MEVLQSLPGTVIVVLWLLYSATQTLVRRERGREMRGRTSWREESGDWRSVGGGGEAAVGFVLFETDHGATATVGGRRVS
jgi:hypothetical protein